MNDSVLSSAYSAERPVEGVGLGLRNAHISEILQTKPNIAWFEVLADNHMALGGLAPAQLRAIRQEYPLNFHCVGMSLAGTDPLDMVYLNNIKRSSGKLSASQRLDIYRSTSVTAKINALRLTYPVCEQIVGERAFVNLARSYALKHASLSSDLNSYGEDFCEHVDQVQREHGYTDYYYLKDLCSLEQLWHKAYYAENDTAFNVVDFQAEYESSQEITLNLSHSLALMKTKLPVHLIWQQHREKTPKAMIKAMQESYCLCIFRDEFQSKIEAIDHAIYEFLLACEKGMSLQKISADSQYESAMNEIPTLIQRGWICNFSSLEIDENI